MTFESWSGEKQALAAQVVDYVHGREVHQAMITAVGQGLLERLDSAELSADERREVGALLHATVARAIPYETTRTMYIRFFGAAFQERELNTIVSFYGELCQSQPTIAPQRSTASDDMLQLGRTLAEIEFPRRRENEAFGYDAFVEHVASLYARAASAERLAAVVGWFQSELGRKLATALESMHRDVAAWARPRLRAEAASL